MNQKRFEAIYRLHYEELLSFAKNHVSDSYQAEDLVQETFLFFLEHGMNTVLCKNDSLYSILISLLKTTLEQPFRLLSFDDDAFTNSEISWFSSSLFQIFSKQQMEHKTLEKLKTLFLELSIEVQQLLSLYYFDEKNAKEISQVLSLKHDTIRKKLERSKKKLKQLYLQQTT